MLLRQDILQLIILLIIAQLCPITVASFVWVGGVTDTEAHFRVNGYHGATFLLSSTNPSDGSVLTQTMVSTNMHLNVTDLSPSTKYFYSVSDRQGSFSTFPAEGSVSSFKFAFGSCAYFADIGIYDRILERGIDFFVHMGDIFYADIGENDASLYEAAFDDLLGGEAESPTNFFLHTPIAYVWDDHDFGENNADGTSSSKQAALTSYDNNVPHYPFPESRANQSSAIYQAFTVGRVRIILSDVRSETYVDLNEMMSEHQLQWLLKEFSNSSSYAMMIWVTSKPWVGTASATNGDWTEFTYQRRRIANHIANNGIDNLVAISGDAHMLAIDDGSNTDYSDDGLGAAGFPLMHSAPIWNTGSSKGGPYSHGCHGYWLYPVSQYSTMQIIDHGGNNVCFEWKGYRADGPHIHQEMITYSTCYPFVKAGSAGAGSCDIPFMPIWMWFMYSLLMLELVIFQVHGMCLGTRCCRTICGKCQAITWWPRCFFKCCSSNYAVNVSCCERLCTIFFPIIILVVTGVCFWTFEQLPWNTALMFFVQLTFFHLLFTGLIFFKAYTGSLCYQRARDDGDDDGDATTAGEEAKGKEYGGGEGGTTAEAALELKACVSNSSSGETTILTVNPVQSISNDDNNNNNNNSDNKQQQ